MIDAMTSPELTGTLVPLVTPFADDESFDARAMRQLVDYVLEQGADGLMPTALTGEGPLLDGDETLAVWDVVFERVGGQRASGQRQGAGCRQRVSGARMSSPDEKLSHRVPTAYVD